MNGLRVFPSSPTAEPIDPLDADRARELEIRREELTALCTHMEYLCSWYEFHEKQIRAMNNRAAGSAHSHFIDGVIFARCLARAAGLEIDRDGIQAKNWTAPSSVAPPAPEVGPAPAFEYLGGNLGLGNGDEPRIEARGPNGTGTLTIERALFWVDQFAEPGRTRLLFAAGMHYGVMMNRGTQ
jgi:hypothetical protein